jgi:hypothetical protein
MTYKNFNVKQGLRTGNITLDASSGNANVANITVTNLANIGVLSVKDYVASNLIPNANGTYSIGNAANRFQNIALSGNIDINGYVINANATTATFSGNIVADGANFNSISINNTLEINSTTDSTSTDTGSFVTAGGVGIAKDVTVGGNINLTGGGTTPKGSLGYNSGIDSFEFKFK